MYLVGLYIYIYYKNDTRTLQCQVGYTFTGLDRPLGLQGVEAPKFLDNRHMKAVGLSTISIGRLYPQDIFLVLISVRG